MRLNLAQWGADVAARRFRMLYAAFAQAPATSAPGSLAKLETEVTILEVFEAAATEFVAAPQLGPLLVPVLRADLDGLSFTDAQATMLRQAVLSVGWPLSMKADALALVQALS